MHLGIFRIDFDTADGYVTFLDSKLIPEQKMLIKPKMTGYSIVNMIKETTGSNRTESSYDV